MAAQLGLFGIEEPAFDATFARVQHRELAHDAWVEYVPGWLRGHEAVFDVLLRSTRWRSGEERMYDRLVVTPRVFGTIPEDGPGHPVIEAMRVALSQRYAEAFERVSLALYRDGRDSVAFHGDRVARTLPQALVATVSVGAPRRCLLRPLTYPAAEQSSRPYGGGASIAWNLGWGDLFVMGGSCQRTWQHAIPKCAHADPRIAIMFRPHWPG